MNIKVIGMGCEKCDTLYANTLRAVSRLGLEAEVEKVEDLVEIVRLGVLSAPSLMVDGKVLSAGAVLDTDAVAALLQKAAK